MMMGAGNSKTGGTGRIRTIKLFFLCMYLYYQHYVIITNMTLEQDLPQNALEPIIQSRLA